MEPRKYRRLAFGFRLLLILENMVFSSGRTFAFGTLSFHCEGIMARDDDDDGSPASPTAEALMALAVLMNRLGTNDHPEITAFIAAHGELPDFVSLSRTARAVWSRLNPRSAECLIPAGAAETDQKPVDQSLADKLAELAVIMHRVGSNNHPEVTAFIEAHKHIPEFPQLAKAARGVWRMVNRKQQ
jgi:hypothetical protein